MRTTNQSNLLTQEILEYCFKNNAFAFRLNTIGVPTPTGFRPPPTSGLPDIVLIFPPDGRFVGIEVKIGKDKQRPSQVEFERNSTQSGAVYRIVKSFNDFLNLWKELKHQKI